MAGSQINFDSRTCPGSHISPDPLCVKFTCSPPPHVGSSPGRLFSTRSPPTCKPGGLEIMCERDRLCVSARPAEDWWSVQDVPRPPTSAFWDRLLPPQIEIHAASVRRLLSCVFYGWRLHKASILSVGGCVFFFLQCFQVPPVWSFFMRCFTHQHSKWEVRCVGEVFLINWWAWKCFWKILKWQRMAAVVC